MEFKKWKHVRVLNLSDLRDKDSQSFYGLFPRVERATESDKHSIFSQQRSVERNNKLSSAKIIIAAWGVSPKLDSLVNKCIDSIQVSFIGWKNKTGRYYHPLPRNKGNQKEWLHKVCKELEEIRE